MLVGGVVAATIAGGALPSIAASVTTRTGEIVAREAPGSGQAGIAVLRGTDRVRLLGEREGWSEILLPDGRRAWVPTGDVTRIDDSPRTKESPIATPGPSPTESLVVAPQRNTEELGAEIVRLRSVVDQLAAWRPSECAPSSPAGGDALWLIAGAALIVGALLGSAWERHRNRRDRSLKF